MSKAVKITLGVLFVGAAGAFVYPMFAPIPKGVRRHVPPPREYVLDDEARKLAGDGRLDEAANRLEQRLKLKGNAESRFFLAHLYIKMNDRTKARTHIHRLLEDPLTTDSMSSPLIVEVFEIAKKMGLENATRPMVDRALARIKPNRLQIDLDSMGSPDERILASFTKAGESENPFPVIEWTDAPNSKLAALDLAAALYTAYSMNYHLALQLCRKALAAEPSDPTRIYAAYFASQIPGRRKEVEGYLGDITQKDVDTRRCIGIIRGMTRD